ncbi:hypothetical protein KKD03_03000, partial [Patescibacteria group bacterium]|nr:hypothetical protein [Patescibacteria group bacterium]
MWANWFATESDEQSETERGTRLVHASHLAENAENKDSWRVVNPTGGANIKLELYIKLFLYNIQNSSISYFYQILNKVDYIDGIVLY